MALYLFIYLRYAYALGKYNLKNDYGLSNYYIQPK